MIGNTEKEKMEKLLEGRTLVRGYVYRGVKREEYWFEKTPENIAAFIARFPCADKIILTDLMDCMILDTVGWFIDTCPDIVLLEQVKRSLIPVQMGEEEPDDLFYPSIDQVEAYCEQESGSFWAFWRNRNEGKL